MKRLAELERERRTKSAREAQRKMDCLLRLGHYSVSLSPGVAVPLSFFSGSLPSSGRHEVDNRLPIVEPPSISGRSNFVLVCSPWD